MHDRGTATPTREEMLARARDMIPTLRARAAQCEAERRLPAETHRDFIERGFYRIHQPKRWGGYELDWALLCDMTVEIGRGCGSSAWVFAQLAGHVYYEGMRPLEGQEFIWGKNSDATVCSCFPIEGKTERVPGGYRLNGAWNFSSGCDVAEFNDFMCFVPREGGGPPVHLFCTVPKEETEIVDDWFVTGMAGTGSKRVLAKNVFVPEHRALQSELCRGGPSPGSSVNPGPIYKVPLMGAGAQLFVGTVIGCARGALDEIEAELKGKKSVAGVNLGELQSVHLRLAEAGALIDAAHALMTQDNAETWRYAVAGEMPPLLAKTKWRKNGAFANKLALQAIELLYPLAGGRGLAVGSAFQRHWRDAHAAASQIIVNADLMSTHYGRAFFGLPVADPRI